MYKVASANQQKRGSRAVLEFTYPEAARFANEDRGDVDPQEAERIALENRDKLDETRENFRQFLVSQRERSGLTRAQFAKKIGVTPICLARYENGTSRVTPEGENRIASRLRALDM